MTIKATRNDVALSGHGKVELNGNETTVPGGFELVVLAPPGASITDKLGGMIEQGKAVEGLALWTPSGNGLPSRSVAFQPLIFRAGSKCPDYVLSPPTGLALRPGIPHMIGVLERTPLSQLWPRVQVFFRAGDTTRVFWCACASIRGAEQHSVDAA